MQPDCQVLSHRAEIFRSKLIEDFHLLETMSEHGRKRAPVYNSSDVLDVSLLENLLIRTPEQTIKFKVYKRDQAPGNIIDRRLTRTRNQNKLPIGVWARWLVENETFQKCLMAFVIINSISIGIQGELPLSDGIGLEVLNQVLEFIDMFSVVVFSIEIVLKLMDNFWSFWKNGWNVFDLIVTVMSAVPHMVVIVIGNRQSKIAVVAEQLAIFRILRALKMISKFGGLRIIVLTILQAFQSILFITILLFTVAYIFAVIGVIFFESFTNSQQKNLQYHRSFSNLPNALITLFQLFTLDQWYNIYTDITKVSSEAFTCTYILLWIWVGAFVFRNLFVGIMVNNFQSISAAVTREQIKQDYSEELARMKEELHLELLKHDIQMQTARKSMTPPDEDLSSVHFQTYEDLPKEEHDAIIAEEKISEGWAKTVRSHLIALGSDPGETLWPRDTLFKYLQFMEQLQENLEEYDNMQCMAKDYILTVHDIK